MKTIKEILELALNNIDSINIYGEYGLCSLNQDLHQSGKISLDEYCLFKQYIRDNRPINLHFLFKRAFYWTPGRKSPRIKWLKKHIKKNDIKQIQSSNNSQPHVYSMNINKLKEIVQKIDYIKLVLDKDPEK
jgi:hypothetical protein